MQQFTNKMMSIRNLAEAEMRGEDVGQEGARKYHLAFVPSLCSSSPEALQGSGMGGKHLPTEGLWRALE